MINPVYYGSNLATSHDTARGPSKSIWNRCPVLEIIRDPSRGIYFFDDFEKNPVITTPTITTQAAYGQGYKAFGSSSGTLLSGGSEFGDIVLTSPATDNAGVGIATIGLPFRITRAYSHLVFEARVKTNTITDTQNGFLLGLMDSQTLSATVPITAAGAIADVNIVGFRKDEADGDNLDTVYKADGVTAVTVQSDVVTSANSTSGSALAANSYYKLGMSFDVGNNVLTYFVNGIPLSSTKTIPSAAGTDFPNDVTMGLVLAMLNATATGYTVTMDWWGVGYWSAS